MDFTLNVFDLSFIFGLIFFVVFAFFRGFVREIFSLLNWVISTVATIYLSDVLAKLFRTLIDNVFVGNVLSVILSFMVIFIVSTLLTRKLSSTVREKIPYTTDQVLGVAYGFLKTFLVFGLIYSFTVNTHGMIFAKSSKRVDFKESMPSWLYESKFRSVISPFGNSLDPVVKMIIRKVSPRFNFKEIAKEEEKQKKESGSSSVIKVIKKMQSEEIEELQPYGVFDKKVKKTAEKIKKGGYDKEQVEKMNHLIEIVK